MKLRIVTGGTFAILVVCAFSACGSTRPVTESTRSSVGPKVLSVRLMRAPRGVVLDEPVWLASMQRVVVLGDSGGGAWNRHLYGVDMSASRARLTRLRLPRARGCVSAQFAPAALSDGSLAYLATCFGNPARLPNRAVSLNRFNPRTRRGGRLRPYSLPFRTGSFSFSPDMNRGLVAVPGGLAWLNRSRPTAAHIAVPAPGYPAWAPDGRSIAVSSGVADTPSRQKQAAYLVDAGTLKARLLLGKLASTGPLVWSPNSCWLAGPLQPEGSAAGLWLVEVRTGHLTLLRKGTQFGAPAWLPDGRTIVAPIGIYSRIPGAAKIVGRSPVGLVVLQLSSAFGGRGRGCD